jgi:adenylate cyclase
LRDYHRDMGKLIHEHGGTLEQFAGDSLMVIFNDPIVIEDPAGCAIRMAVAMRERFAQMMVPWKKRGHEIGLGIGIAHGYATIGAIGFEDRIGYGVIGRVTNLAARLCAEAKEDQILVSQPVLALVEDLVEAEDAGQLTLKGFARPVSACSVVRLK